MNEDGSTTETKSMFKSKFGGQKRLDQAYANAVSDNDKAKSGNAKTKYIINPQGDYYKVTKNSNGTTTETKSIPKSAKNLKNSIAFKKKYSQIYNTNYNKRQEIKDWYKKNAKHSEDHEGMILIHSQANVELYHWGILGMKWGVRRWQNPDGTLTEAGKAHYGKMSGESASKEASNAASAKATAKSTPAISAVSGIAEGAAKTVTNTVAGEATKRVLAGTVDGFVKGSVIGALAGLTVAGLYQLGKHISQKRKEKAEKILEENKEKEAEKFLKEEEYINKNSKNSQEAREAIENENLDLIDESAYFKDKKRADAAAKLGIKALIKNKEDYGGDLDPEDKDTREWFIEEDQTIGLGTIADLVNQGKSKQYIVKTIENLEKADYDFDDRKAPEGSFALSWSGYEKNNSVDKFIDACIEIREEEKRTH